MMDLDFQRNEGDQVLLFVPGRWSQGAEPPGREGTCVEQSRAQPEKAQCGQAGKGKGGFASS